jgi:3-methyladenine DNA glycosylase AlkD
VVGRYLFDKPRDVLHELARSENVWERRTAIVATSHFIRQGDVAATFEIAELLREAGKKDRQRLLSFLDKHATTMLRYAIEHLDKGQRDHYLNMKKAAKADQDKEGDRS